MTDFVIPATFEELLEDSTKRFSVSSDDIWVAEDKADAEVMSIIDDLSMMFDDNEGMGFAEYDQELINNMYSIINNLPYLAGNIIEAYGESMLSLVTKLVKIFSNGRNTVLQDQAKATIFFLQIFCIRYEECLKTKPADSRKSVADDRITNKTTKQSSKQKKSASGNSTNPKTSHGWASQRLQALELFDELLAVDPDNIWEMGIIPENFLFHIWKYSLNLLDDRPFDTNSSTAQYCISVITKCSTLFSIGTNSNIESALTPLSSAIVNCICQSENIIALSRDISELCMKANPVLMAEILNEFGRMNMAEKAKVKSTVKNTQTFLVKLADTTPEQVCQYLSLIIDQIDCEEYGVRNAILEVMGVLAAYISNRNKAYIAFGNGTVTAAVIADPDEEGRVLVRLLKLYESICDHLIVRVHDVKSYTRSTALKILSELVEKDAINIDKFAPVGKLALDRLMDKAVYVRKAAIALLTAMLDHNPFGGCLDANSFREEKVGIEKAIALRLEILHGEAENGVDSAMDDAEESSNKNIANSKADDDDEIVEDGDGDEEPRLVSDEDFQTHVEQDVELQRLQQTHASAAAALDFIEIVDVAQELIKLMVRSKTNTDVVEALRFFMRAVNFGLNGSMSFLCSTFQLIWHQEDSIKKQCMETFKHVFLTDGASHNTVVQPAEVIVRDLIKLCQECDAQSYTSLEQLIEVLMKEKDSVLNDNFTDNVWRAVKTFALEATRVAADTAAVTTAAPAPRMSLVAASLHLASMVTRALPERTTERKVQILLAAGLCDRVLVAQDVDAMRAVAKCLQNILPVNCKSANEEERAMSYALEKATPSLLAIISGRCCDDDESGTRKWYSACEECMHALYHIHSAPEKIASVAIVQLYEALGSHSDISENDSTRKLFSSVPALSRLLFTLGQAALCSVVFTEKLAKLAKKAGDKQGFKSALSEDTPRTADKDEEVEVEHEKEGTESNAMEEEMGLAAAADADHEKLLDFTTENDLVCDQRYLFGKLHPLVAFIVANEKGKFSHPMLQDSALLALCRLMSVSSVLAELYLPLLFTVLEKYPLSAAQRSTIMIAVGDLAFRFPNSLEPWTARMYSRLSEKNVVVRYNSLMVLTHLILNDMVKVKGQVSQVVLCLVDTSESIRGLAMLFFTELARRSNNPVYNLLGDIIGTLSSRSGEDSGLGCNGDGLETSKELTGRVLSAMEFQTAMTFLLKFVTKDKQADSLLERLLMRMETASSSRQLRNLAFCVSQLPISEKGVRRMIELIKHYKDSLHDKEVRTYLLEAVNRSKKGPKAGDSIRIVVDEFVLLVATTLGEASAAEGLLADDDECEVDVDEDGEPIVAADKVVPSDPTARTKPLGAKGKCQAGSGGVGGRSKKVATAAADKRKTQKKKAKRKTADDDDDDEDDDNNASDIDENFVVSNVMSKTAKPRAGKKQAERPTKQTQSIHVGRPRRALVEVSYCSDDEFEE